MPTAEPTLLRLLDAWRRGGPKRDVLIFSDRRNNWRKRYHVELYIASGEKAVAQAATPDEAIRKALEAANANH